MQQDISIVTKELKFLLKMLDLSLVKDLWIIDGWLTALHGTATVQVLTKYKGKDTPAIPVGIAQELLAIATVRKIRSVTLKPVESEYIHTAVDRLKAMLKVKRKPCSSLLIGTRQLKPFFNICQDVVEISKTVDGVIIIENDHIRCITPEFKKRTAS